MPRKPSWNGPTTAIRVPQHCADELLAIAKLRDSRFCTKPDPEYAVLVTLGDGDKEYHRVCKATQSEWELCDRLAQQAIEEWTAAGMSRADMEAAVVVGWKKIMGVPRGGL